MISTDRTTAPKLKDIGDIKIPEPEIFHLSNDVEVYAINAGKQDIIKIELIFPGGRWHEPQRLVSKATSKMLKEGTNQFSGKELADKIENLGAMVMSGESMDYNSVELICLSKHLPVIIPLVNDILTEATFPEDELKTFVQNSIQALRVKNKKNGYVAKKKLFEVVFGNQHPYGYHASEEDYFQIKREDLAKFYADHFSQGNCRIIVSGKGSSDHLGLLDKHMGNNKWQTEHKTSEEVPLKSSKEKNHPIIKAESVQSAIQLGIPFINKKHPDYPGIIVLNTAFGGYFGSRLMSNIRQDKGFTYGVYSRISSFQNGALFHISSEVNAENRKEAIEEIYLEMKRLQEEPIPAEELYLVKNYLLGSLLSQVDGPFDIASTLKGLILYNLGIDYFYKLVDTIKTISAEDLLQLAQKYFSPGDMFEVTVG